MRDRDEYQKKWRQDNPEKDCINHLRYWVKRAVQLGLDPMELANEEINKSNKDTEKG